MARASDVDPDPPGKRRASPPRAGPVEGRIGGDGGLSPRPPLRQEADKELADAQEGLGPDREDPLGSSPTRAPPETKGTTPTGLFTPVPPHQALPSPSLDPVPGRRAEAWPWCLASPSIFRFSASPSTPLDRRSGRRRPVASSLASILDRTDRKSPLSGIFRLPLAPVGDVAGALHVRHPVPTQHPPLHPGTQLQKFVEVTVIISRLRARRDRKGGAGHRRLRSGTGRFPFDLRLLVGGCPHGSLEMGVGDPRRSGGGSRRSGQDPGQPSPGRSPESRT